MAEEAEHVAFPEIPDNLVDDDEAAAVSRGPSFLKTPHMSSISFASSAHQEIKRPPFAEPEQDPYTKAIQYLEQHHIVELFQVQLNICSYNIEYSFTCTNIKIFK